MKRQPSIGILFVFALALIGILAAQALASQPAQAADLPPRTITTLGEAQVVIAPDKAQLSFGVETTGATAQEALRSNATQMERVIAALKAEGIKEENIQTSGFSLQPNYDWVREGNRENRRLVGFIVNNNVRVTTSDLDNLGPLIDITVAAGANTVQGISFTVKNPADLQKKALAAAVKDARGKAEALAQAGGTQITGLLTIEETGSYGFESITLERSKMVADGAATPVEPGRLSLSAQVKVTFSH